MSYEEELTKRVSSPHFSAISGSRLYGTKNETSDVDIRAFTIPPFEYLIGVRTFESQSLPGDHIVFSVKRWLELALNGDPLITELFFCPKDNILQCDDIGQRVLEIGLKYALSNKSYSRIMGYSNGEWRKAMAIKVVPEKKKKEETEILNDFWNCFDWLSREKKEIIIKTINEGRPQKIVSSTSGLGKKRKSQVEKHGYCTKSAAHAIRLLNQVTELMLTGSIVFPRPEADVLRSIRCGEISRNEVASIYEDSRSVAERTREKSVLPDKPDVSSLWEEYSEIIKEHINNMDILG